MRNAKVGDKVTVIDGSSDGHTGTVIALKQKACVRIKRDADGVEADVWHYYIHEDNDEQDREVVGTIG